MPMQRSFDIGKRRVGEGAPVYVIAEAGSNHDGRLDRAHSLIDVAVEAGADAVKFQTFSANRIAAQAAIGATRLTDKFGRFGGTLVDFYKKLELPAEWHRELQAYAADKGITFLSTPFDEAAADLLEKLNIPAYKIASFELVHLPLLRHVASKGKPVVLSTGMATLGEIEDALAVLSECGNDQVALLHCGIEYPVVMQDVHLAAMDTLRQAFPCPVGYSDHTLGLTVPIAAVARGASIIEKHFTLDRSLHGPDHEFALTPDELKAMILAIRDTEAAIGSSIKRPLPSESVHHQRGRRSLFAVRDIAQGEVISRDMVAVLRPGTGLAPKCLDIIVGRVARRAIAAHHPIMWEDV